jgi:S1-C subfamily serine protease
VAAAAVGAAVGAGVLLALGISGDGGAGDVRENVVAPGDDHDPAELASEMLPAVVRIDVTRDSTVSSGVGVIFRDDGHVLTSADLVAEADQVTAVLDSGEAVPATVVGADATSDVGVVLVEGGGRSGATLGNPSALQEGEVTVAIVPPAGRTTAPTVSKSIVLDVDADIEGDGWTHYGMLQLSSRASAFPPGTIILDQSGAVVGITTTRQPSVGATRTTLVDAVAVEGTDYATPVDFARRVAEDLIEVGVARHSWLGFDGEDVDAPDGGVAVTSFHPESPAAAAGLKAHDVITEIDGAPVESMSDLVVELRTREPGEQVELVYERYGKTYRCSPVIETPPSP